MCDKCREKDQENAILKGKMDGMREMLEWIRAEDKDWRVRDKINEILYNL
jgi:hypothetical protein